MYSPTKILIILFAACSFSAFSQKKLTPAQKKFSDSVTKALTGQSDSVKHQVLVALFEKNRAKSYNRAIIVGKRALPFVKKSPDLDYLAQFYLHLAQIECKFGEEGASVPYYREAARIYRSLNQPAKQAEVYEDLVSCSDKKKEYDVAYRYLVMAKEIRDSIKDETNSRAYNGLLAKYELEKSEKDSKIADQQKQISMLGADSRENTTRSSQVILYEGIAIGVLFIVLIVYMYSRSRLKTQLSTERTARQTEKRERMQISKDIHDDLDLELSKINNLSQEVYDKPNASENRQSIFSIMEISTMLMGSMRDLVWQLNIENSTLENLIAKIREYSTDYLKDSSVEIVGRYPDKVPDIFIQRVSFHNIFVVVKETLHNLSHHSKAMNANISVDVQNDRLHITIVDDGIGFDRTLDTKGNGLKSMQNRMRAIGGLFNIISEPNKGTTITIDIGLIQIARK